jgi:hypothetical protein
MLLLVAFVHLALRIFSLLDKPFEGAWYSRSYTPGNVVVLEKRLAE